MVMLFTPLLNCGFLLKYIYVAPIYIVGEEPKNKSRYKTSLRAKEKENKNPWGRDHTRPLSPVITDCFPLELTRS